MNRGKTFEQVCHEAWYCALFEAAGVQAELSTQRTQQTIDDAKREMSLMKARIKVGIQALVSSIKIIGEQISVLAADLRDETRLNGRDGWEPLTLEEAKRTSLSNLDHLRRLRDIMEIRSGGNLPLTVEENPLPKYSSLEPETSHDPSKCSWAVIKRQFESEIDTIKVLLKTDRGHQLAACKAQLTSEKEHTQALTFLLAKAREELASWKFAPQHTEQTAADTRRTPRAPATPDLGHAPMECSFATMDPQRSVASSIPSTSPVSCVIASSCARRMSSSRSPSFEAGMIASKPR